jgi:hypothetical protein
MGCTAAFNGFGRLCVAYKGLVSWLCWQSDWAGSGSLTGFCAYEGAVIVQTFSIDKADSNSEEEIYLIENKDAYN